jgi:transposase
MPDEQKESDRAYYIKGACEGIFTISQVADRLHICTRRVKYLKAAYRKMGDAAFIHGNKGRTPVNKIPDDVFKKIVALKMTEPYRRVNFARFAEILRERGMSYDYTTIRKILVSAGIKSPKRHRLKKENVPCDWLGSGGLGLVFPRSSKENVGSYIDMCASYLSGSAPNGFERIDRTVYMNEEGSVIIKVINGTVVGSAIGNTFERTSEARKWQSQFYDFFERNNWMYSEVSKKGVEEIYIKDNVYALIISPWKKDNDLIVAMVMFVDDLNNF